MSEPTETHFPKSLPFLRLGIILIAITALISARLTWEMTILTWQSGPQMVGFSLAHGPTAPFLFAPLLLALWTIICAILAITCKLRHQPVTRPTWPILAIATIAFTTLAIPQSFWNHLFLHRLTTSAHAADFLVDAAADGDLTTVRALLDHGANIESSTNNHTTALHAAANAGKPTVAAYLLARGADPNSLDSIGESPLHDAIEGHHPDVADLLRAHGGKRSFPRTNEDRA